MLLVMGVIPQQLAALLLVAQRRVALRLAILQLIVRPLHLVGLRRLALQQLAIRQPVDLLLLVTAPRITQLRVTQHLVVH